MPGLVAGEIQGAPAKQMIQLIGLDGKPASVTEDDLAGMDWQSLLALRRLNDSPELQTVLAPYEHRAYARETTRERPLMGASLAVATPLYAAAKGLGLIGSRSGASNPAGQVSQGFKGIGEGLVGAARDAGLL